MNKHNVLNILFPRCCPVCKELLQDESQLICISCESRLLYNSGPVCLKCGKPVEYEETEYCYDCYKKKHHYERGYSVFLYDDIMKQLIGDFKYRNKKEYADLFVHRIVERRGRAITELGLDAIIPIPVHPAKKRYRGYNQAQVLSEGIGKALSIPVVSDILKRNRNTMPQKQLNDIERLRNLEKAFIFDERNTKKAEKLGIRLQKVLLVDDIYTTGSTMEACTKILLANGVSTVYFVSLCTGRGL